ncbi:DNA-formamidopyrimidine glycosylase [Hutsoniella sourekii]
MPELPEVESVRRGLNQKIIGKTIDHVQVTWPRIINHPEGLSQWQALLEGQTVQAIDRRGKYLLLELTDWTLVSHLRMEGKYLFGQDLRAFQANKHVHVIFCFTDGTYLAYQDVRKFGRMELIAPDQKEAYFKAKKLGPEPTQSDFDLSSFKQALAKSRKKIKPALLDQHLVAGLGNIYVDEALYQARIHPARLANSLKEDEVATLRLAIIDILSRATQAGGSTIRTYLNALGEAGNYQESLKVYDQAGQACPRCQTPLEKIKLAGRGTHFCPNCQRLEEE